MTDFNFEPSGSSFTSIAVEQFNEALLILNRKMDGLDSLVIYAQTSNKELKEANMHITTHIMMIIQQNTQASKVASREKREECKLNNSEQKGPNKQNNDERPQKCTNQGKCKPNEILQR